MPSNAICTKCGELYTGGRSVMLGDYGLKLQPDEPDRDVSVCMAPFSCVDREPCPFFSVDKRPVGTPGKIAPGKVAELKRTLPTSTQEAKLKLEDVRQGDRGASFIQAVGKLPPSEFMTALRIAAGYERPIQPKPEHKPIGGLWYGLAVAAGILLGCWLI